MSEAEVLIEVSDLKVGYGEHVVLENVEFQVKTGEIFVILGRSGSGKSTLLKCLIGLIEPLSGSIRINGQDLTKTTGSQRRAILQRFGVLYQAGALFGSMTVLENVRLPLDEFTDLPKAAKNLVAVAKLKLVGFDHPPESMPAELSGGTQKRAALARAMALDPPILFLDEPSVGLDPISAATLDELIKRLARSFGITFVIVSHELPSVYSIATRVILIDEGVKGIIAEGPPARLREHPANEAVRRFMQREPQPEFTGNSHAAS